MRVTGGGQKIWLPRTVKITFKQKKDGRNPLIKENRKRRKCTTGAKSRRFEGEKRREG